MKNFWKNVSVHIVSTYTIMIVTFSCISAIKGLEVVPVNKLFELALLAVFGGIWMEVSFGTCIIKKMSDIKRACIYIVPFALVTFACAVVFQWITELDAIGTYLRFIGIFFACWVISVILFEIEHCVKSKQYTKKLREYQERE